MIITCPQCQTKFHLDEGRIPEGGGKARCSRCQHVFEVKKETQDGSSTPASDLKVPPLAKEVSAGPRSAKNTPRILGWVAVVLVLVLLSGSLWTLGMKTPYLRQVEAFFASLRESLGLSDSSPSSVALENLKGYYAENIHLNWVFIVEGQAVNQWNESRSFIKVRGTLLDARGRKVEEKVVFCGNILAERDLREMTRESIQKSLSSQFGVSFSNVNIPPRKAVPFMIVFTDFPQGGQEKGSGDSPSLSDFSVEVISSKKGSK